MRYEGPQTLSVNRIIALSNLALADKVSVDAYEYTPCYLWYDRPVFNEFGEEIRRLKGNTIYLCRDSHTPIRDLFHELGHFVGRQCHLVGNAENGYRGRWENENRKLIAEISEQRHWSHYLNFFSLSQENFKTNAASEVWAELFMMWHLYPDCEEASLLDQTMGSLKNQSVCLAIASLALELDLPGTGTDPDGAFHSKQAHVIGHDQRPKD